MTDQNFRGRIVSSKQLRTDRVLMVDPSFDGDVQSGDWIKVPVASEETETVQVLSVGWGSSMHGDAAPLMLLISGLEKDPLEGGELVGTSAPG